MNKIKLLLVICFVGSGTLAAAQQKDKAVMISTIFSVLKNNDEAGFVNLFPDAVTMKRLIAEMMGKDTFGGDGMKEMMKGVLEKMTDSILKEQYKKEFHKAMKTAEDKKINWSAASMVSFTADSSRINEDGFDASVLQGKIYFTADTGNYFIAYDKIIWLEDKGWYGVSIDRIDEKGRENEEEIMIVPEGVSMDSVVMAVDTMVQVAAPKPVKKTTPVKPAGKPIKSKPTVPARKPE